MRNPDGASSNGTSNAAGDLAPSTLLALLCSLIAACGLALGCGADAGAPSAPDPSARGARTVAAPSPVAPTGPPARPAVAPPSRPPPGTPTVELPNATYWTNPARGLVLRAERAPSASPRGDAPAFGEVTVLARERAAPGHLAIAGDGDLYWVEYRRADARCDFVRVARGAGAPELLFEDALGDFSETICETSLAVDARTEHLFWIHGSEIHAAPPLPGGARRIVARGQPFPRELATDATHVYWLALGGDPYEDVLTGLGSLRAVPKQGGEIQVLLGGLTEPSGLVVAGPRVELQELGEEGEIIRRTVPAPPPG